MAVFEDRRFTDSLKELESPKLDDYELFVECMGVTIYRKYIEVSEMYMLLQLISKVQTG